MKHENQHYHLFCTDLHKVGEELYPMSSSTAAETEVELGIRSSRKLKLQDKCVSTILRNVSRQDKNAIDVLPLPNIIKTELKAMTRWQVVGSNLGRCSWLYIDHKQNVISKGPFILALHCLSNLAWHQFCLQLAHRIQSFNEFKLYCDVESSRTAIIVHLDVLSH